VIVDRLGKRVRSSASLLRDDGGRVIGAVAVFREPGNRQLPPKRPCSRSQHYTFEDIVGESRAITGVKIWARQAASSSSTVLIEGESGTGKELFAQAIHYASPRSESPFVAINCGAMPENLIESELFGYEEGSFTGAKKGGHPGKFAMADGGTLFLDEIGDMSLPMQMKVLRVIREKKVARIGSAKERSIDVRLIAATHKDLSIEVQQGRFRHDLYYRLHVLDIRIPALRERVDDILAIGRHLVEKIAARLNVGPIRIESSFLKQLQSHSWPGNVRELENTIERAIIRAGEEGVLTADLIDFDGQEAPLALAEEEVAPVKLLPEGPTPVKSLREVEKEMISKALAVYKGNIQKASAKLGIGRNTLYRKIKEYGLSPYLPCELTEKHSGLA
jgi:transcriptional regulator with PAS, ATPase and Fis domain